MSARSAIPFAPLLALLGCAGGAPTRGPEPPPSIVTVLAVDCDGRAVPGATVEVFHAQVARQRFLPGDDAGVFGPVPWQRHDLAPWLTAVTDGDGCCAVPMLYHDAFASVRKDGVGAIDGLHLTAADTEPAIARLTRQLFLHGTVLDAEGQPVVGAVVQPGGMQSPRHSRELEPVQSDANGCFHLPVSGLRVLRIDAEGADFEPLLVNAGECDDVHATVRALGTYEIAGTVRDARGRPCSGRVWVWPLDSLDLRLPNSGDPRVLSTAADGTFTVPLGRAGRHMVLAVADDGSESEAMRCIVDGDRRRSEVDLRCLPDVDVSGTVVLGDDSRAADAVVRATRELTWDAGGVPIATRTRSARADSRGSFLMPLPARSHWHIDVLPTAEAWFAPLPLQVPGGGAARVALRAAPEVALTVTVRAAHDGAPVVGALVALADEEPRATDARGRVTFPAVLGGQRYAPTARAPGFAPGTAPAFRMPSRGYTVELELSRPATAVVRVCHADGAPAIALMVGHVPPRQEGRAILPPGRTDARGELRVTDLGPGEHRFLVLRDRRPVAETTVEVRPGHEHTVELRLPETDPRNRN